MGGITSSFSYWTPEQEAQNKRTQANFLFAKTWILEYMYHGIPVRAGQASHDPRSPLWVELDPKIVEEAMYVLMLYLSLSLCHVYMFITSRAPMEWRIGDPIPVLQ